MNPTCPADLLESSMTQYDCTCTTAARQGYLVDVSTHNPAPSSQYSQCSYPVQVLQSSEIEQEGGIGEGGLDASEGTLGSVVPVPSLPFEAGTASLGDGAVLSRGGVASCSKAFVSLSCLPSDPSISQDRDEDEEEERGARLERRVPLPRAVSRLPGTNPRGRDRTKPRGKNLPYQGTRRRSRSLAESFLPWTRKTKKNGKTRIWKEELHPASSRMDHLHVRTHPRLRDPKIGRRGGISSPTFDKRGACTAFISFS